MGLQPARLWRLWKEGPPPQNLEQVPVESLPLECFTKSMKQQSFWKTDHRLFGGR